MYNQPHAALPLPARWKLLRLLVAVLFLVPLQGADDQDHKHLTILHVNDIHGFMRPFLDKASHPDLPVGGSAYLAGLIMEARQANPEGTVLVSAGDMFQGTAISNRFYGQPMVDLMNYLGFDASAIGNHEFDWGIEKLQKTLSGARFPFLAANVLDSEGGQLAGTKPFALIERNGLKIALIGVCSTETPRLTLYDNVKSMKFLGPETVLPALVRQVRKDGARLVVVLSHLGLEGDRKMARDVPGIDVVVGGHVHTPLFEPILEGDTVIVQAGCYGLYLGVLNLRVPLAQGKPVEVEPGITLRRIVAGPNATFDIKADQIVKRYFDQIAKEYAEVVGETTVELVHPPSGESNLGNLICDAIREKTGADIAVQNGGGIRAGIPVGKITLEQITAVMPFDNQIITLQMSGRDIRELFTKNTFWRKTGLQISGARIVYSQNEKAVPMLVSITVGDLPLDDDRIYRVSTNDFLLKGGDGYTTFAKGTAPVPGPLIREAIRDHVKAHSPLSTQKDNRIKVE